MEILIILAINFTICHFIAKAGEKREIGFRRSLIFSLLFSVIIGGIITYLSPKLSDKEIAEK